MKPFILWRQVLSVMRRHEVKIAFAAFELIDGLHITIGRRYDATDQEIAEMQEYLDNLLRPQLPFYD